MIPEIGHVALWLALTGAMTLAVLFFFTKQIKLARYLSAINFGSITTAFACLVYSYIVSDFAVLNVAMNSHTAKPLLYKITGAWGNHEGSMLLFVWMLSLYTMLFAQLSQYRQAILVLATQGGILSGILLFMIFTSNPFQRVFPVPEDGMDLNPLLQDIGLAIHPPVLYLGYAGFSLAFSFAVAGLVTRQVTRLWAAQLRPWLLVAWAFLTGGIGLGSWWAYRELGWGGFWFWDPVENSSLAPWLTTAALVHSLAVVQKREALKGWATLLCMLSFIFSLVGFFLVRSGVLTSVHAFANDPARGLFILLLLTLLAGGGLLLFSLRAGALKDQMKFAFVSRETGLLLNNVFFLTLAVTILLGILYPILLEVFAGQHVSVGAPYYTLVFVPLAFAVLALAVVTPHMKWKSDRIKNIFNAQKFSFIAAAAITAITIFLLGMPHFIFSLACFLSIWLVLATWRKLNLKSSTSIGMAVSHTGLAMLTLALSTLMAFQSDVEVLMKKNMSINIAGYVIQLDALHNVPGDNYIAKTATFQISRSNKALSSLRPEVRFYPVRDITTSETAILSTLLGDLLIVIGEGTLEEGLAVRIFTRPAMNMVWLGCFLMLSGALCAAWDKKKRKR